MEVDSGSSHFSRWGVSRRRTEGFNLSIVHLHLPPPPNYYNPNNRTMSRAVNHIGSVFLRTILLRMKVSRPYITKVLHQDVNITFRTAAKLASALKMEFFPGAPSAGGNPEVTKYGIIRA